jgi:hypothetical protein
MTNVGVCDKEFLLWQSFFIKEKKITTEYSIVLFQLTGILRRLCREFGTYATMNLCFEDRC